MMSLNPVGTYTHVIHINTHRHTHVHILDMKSSAALIFHHAQHSLLEIQALSHSLCYSSGQPLLPLQSGTKVTASAAWSAKCTRLLLDLQLVCTSPCTALFRAGTQSASLPCGTLKHSSYNSSPDAVGGFLLVIKKNGYPSVLLPSI